MNCLRCDNDEFALKQDAVVEQEFKGELLKVKTPAMECTKCGWLTVGLDQVDELRRRTADAYREKHCLLTSEQIKACRKLLGKSQREFAAFLGVGEASIKRWETWLVQEKSSDELIRTKCEKEMCKRLRNKTTTTIWIAFQYAKPVIQSSQGVSIQPASTKQVAPDRWARRPSFGGGSEDSQTLANHCDVNEEFALAA